MSGLCTAVLVEGDSDRLAIEALARRYDVDLDGHRVEVITMGGATNVRAFVKRLGPIGEGRRVLGLCDRQETGWFRRVLDPADIFVCDADLEDELIRALGIDAMLAFIDAQGEGDSFRTMQRQPAQRDRSVADQLHRFIGAKSGRKSRYAPRLVDAMQLERTPKPLAALVAAISALP